MRTIAALFAFLCAMLTPEVGRADLILLHSGNGSVGGTDSEVSMLVGPADSPFGVAFTPADFIAAGSGPFASIVAPHADWLPFLPADPTAKWISTDPRGAEPQGDAFGRSALYAIDFVLAGPVSAAILQMNFATDNRLGDLDANGVSNGPNDGVYINGTPISGSYRAGNFFGQFFVMRTDIAPLLHAGSNRLYLNAVDLGGPSGLIFSATIETTPVPEPCTLWLLGCAGPLLLLHFRNRTTAGMRRPLPS
jgi:hypothetical protein